MVGQITIFRTNHSSTFQRYIVSYLVKILQYWNDKEIRTTSYKNIGKSFEWDKIVCKIKETNTEDRENYHKVKYESWLENNYIICTFVKTLQCQFLHEKNHKKYTHTIQNFCKGKGQWHKHFQVKIK